MSEVHLNFLNEKSERFKRLTSVVKTFLPLRTFTLTALLNNGEKNEPSHQKPWQYYRSITGLEISVNWWMCWKMPSLWKRTIPFHLHHCLTICRKKIICPLVLSRWMVIIKPQKTISTEYTTITSFNRQMGTLHRLPDWPMWADSIFIFEWNNWSYPDIDLLCVMQFTIMVT